MEEIKEEIKELSEEEKAFKIVEEANKKRQIEVDKFVKEYRELCAKYGLEFTPVQQLAVIDFKPQQ